MLNPDFFDLTGVFHCHTYVTEKGYKRKFPGFRDSSVIYMDSDKIQRDYIYTKYAVNTEGAPGGLRRLVDEVDTLRHAYQSDIIRVKIEHADLGAVPISPEHYCEVHFSIWLQDTPYSPYSPKGWKYSYSPKDVLPENVGGGVKRYLSTRFREGTSADIIKATEEALAHVREYFSPIKVGFPKYEIILLDTNPGIDSWWL